MAQFTRHTSSAIAKRGIKYKLSIIKLLLWLLLLPSCYKDEAFRDFYEQYEASELWSGVAAESFFLHPELLSQKAASCLHCKEQLQPFDFEALSPKNKKRYQEIEEACNQCLTELAPFFTDPSQFNMGGRIKVILSRPEISLQTKLDLIRQHLLEVENYYAVGKAVLTAPIPIKAQLGAQKQLWALQFLDGELTDSIAAANLKPASHDTLMRDLRNTKLVLKDYLAFCESLYFESQDTMVMAPN